MKKYLVRYTENKGTTYQTIIVNAKSYTKAYVEAMCQISKDSEITGLFEIMENQNEI